MVTSFVPSLQNLCCTKIVPPLFNEVLPLIEVYCLRTSQLLKCDTSVLYTPREKIYNEIYFEIAQKIKGLITCLPLRERLESFIEPLFSEIEEWLRICQNSCTNYEDTLLTILKNVPRCWYFNGSIDREKAAKLLVKNNNASLTSRFVFACIFCLLDDVLDIWKILPMASKIILKHDAEAIVKHCIDWLESSSEKDWQSFVALTSGSSFCCRNLYVLKNVLKTSSPAEKSIFLKNALTMKDVGSDIMHFGLSLMTEKEQLLIFAESPVEVFKCFTSWPMNRFFDVEHILWPYLTQESFCNILDMLLLQIKEQKRDNNELIEILQNFWERSSDTFKDAAYSDTRIDKPLNFVLEYDFTTTFPRDEFSLCFPGVWDYEFDLTYLL